MDSTYSYIQIDKIDWATQEYIVGQTGDLIGDTSQYWSGCYELNQGWGGTSGGGCPALNDQYGGQINYGYVERTLTNLAAINIALEQAGIEATGYNYSWRVKNWDSEYKDSGNGRSTADPFQVEIVVRDTQGNAVFSKTYDYSRYISEWTTFAGEETFANPFDANTLSEIELNVTGKDLGYWAGYYGPEFQDPSIKLNYRYAGNPVADESLEDRVLLSAQCSADPTFSPECPGYNDAVMAQISPQQDIYGTGTQDFSGSSSSTMGGTNDGTMDSTNSGMAGVDQATQAPGSNVQETQAETEPASNQTQGPGLNTDQLAALEAADSVANSAQSIASQSSAQSLTSSANPQSSWSSPGSTDGAGTGFGSNSFGNNTGNSSMGMTGSTSNDNDTALAQGGSVQTEDITGESALAQSNELSQGADMADIELASLNLDLIADVVNSIAKNTLKDIKEEQEEEMEQANEKSIAESNALEDELVAEALAGSDSEEAQLALLGFNPDFRAYQQPQLPDGEIYPPKQVYAGQENYDNPSSRFFNGASDAKHKQMVRSQYE